MNQKDPKNVNFLGEKKIRNAISHLCFFRRAELRLEFYYRSFAPLDFKVFFSNHEFADEQANKFHQFVAYLATPTYPKLKMGGILTKRIMGFSERTHIHIHVHTLDYSVSRGQGYT